MILFIAIDGNRAGGRRRYLLNNFVDFHLIVPIYIEFVENLFSNLRGLGVEAPMLHLRLEFFSTQGSIVVGIEVLTFFFNVISHSSSTLQMCMLFSRLLNILSGSGVGKKGFVTALI